MNLKSLLCLEEGRGEGRRQPRCSAIVLRHEDASRRGAEFSANDWPMIYDRATEETPPSKNGYSAVYREY